MKPTALNESKLRSLNLEIKKILKERKLTYRDVAKLVGVSEVTIKRMLSDTTPSLDSMLTVCEATQIPFFNLVRNMKDINGGPYILTLAQDLAFAKRPKDFAIFIDLYRRHASELIQKKWRLKSGELKLFTKRMSDLGLMEMADDGESRFLMDGPILMNPRGKLRELFLTQNTEFLANADFQSQSGKACLASSETLLSRASELELKEDVEQFVKKWRDRGFSDESTVPKTYLRSIRWLIAFAPFESQWD